MGANWSDQTPQPRRWPSWLLGAALLAGVIGAALHFSDQQAFVQLVHRAKPWWLAVAVVLQAGTYLAQGTVWRRVGDATGWHLPPKTAFELGLAKMFTDQALPSAGLSSSILIAKALEQRHMPSAAVKASVLINLASYHLAYAAALAAALTIMALQGHTSALVVVPALVFVVFSFGLSGAVMTLAGRPHERLAGALRRFPGIRTAFGFLAGADGRIVRSPRVIAETISLQGVIVLLDATTLWILISALGATAPVTGVFASFMVASLSGRWASCPAVWAPSRRHPS